MNTSTKGLKVIGRGAFSTAYLLNAEQVLIRSNDNCKECMALGWFPDSFRFPKVEQVEHGLYLMKYYPNSRSLKAQLDAEEWELYSALHEAHDIHWWPKENEKRYRATIRTFESFPEKFKEVSILLIEACEALMNYGDDVCFEISPRNVRAENGKLIFLDVFFFSSQLAKARGF